MNNTDFLKKIKEEKLVVVVRERVPMKLSNARRLVLRVELNLLKLLLLFQGQLKS